MLQRRIYLKSTSPIAYCKNIFYSTSIQLDGEKLNKYYKVLGLTPDCSKDELKSKYVELAKKYHPDTTSDESDADKFRQIVEAYRFIIDNDYGAKDKEELENVPKIYDIRHTAPQHRQYLEYGGVGYGTPSQRQRQYQQHRVQQAAENVHDYMMQKIMSKEDYSLITKGGVDAEYARKWKTRSAIDRLVEDLIQESMKKGEFNNLAGQGKPLKYDAHNPYVDSMTHKLNQILIQNGFTPEWVLLEKEIKEEKSIIKNLIKEKLNSLGAAGRWSFNDRKMWNEFLTDLTGNCSTLNKKIDHFNLVCPALSRQMVRFQLQTEADKIMSAIDKDSTLPKDNNNNNNSCKQTTEFNATNHDRDSVEIDQKNKQQMGIFKSLLSAISMLK